MTYKNQSSLSKVCSNWLLFVCSHVQEGRTPMWDPSVLLQPKCTSSIGRSLPLSVFAFRPHAQPAPSIEARVYTRLRSRITRASIYHPRIVEKWKVFKESTDLKDLTTQAATSSRVQWCPESEDDRMSRYSGRHRIMGSSHKVALVMTVLETG